MAIKKLIGSVINQPYLFSVISKIVGVVLTIIYGAFYNRYLGPSLKGEAAIIGNYISIISSFACIGMYQAYPYYKKKGEDVFYPFLNTMQTFYTLLLGLALIFAIVAPVESNLKVALILVPIQAFIRHINYMVMVENPRKRNISSMLILLMDIVVVSAFWFGTTATYSNLIIILILQGLINLGISYSNLGAVFKKMKATFKLLPKYARFGVIPMITLFLMTINYQVDILMLQQFDFITTAQIGIYSVGVSLSEKVWLLPDAMKDILLSHLCSKKDNNEVARVTRLSLFIAAILVIGVIAFGKPAIQLLYGVDFIDSYYITVVMLIGVLGMIFYKMVYSFNISEGHRVISLVFLGVAAALNVIGNYFLIPVGGIMAAAWCSVISYTICGLCFLIFFCIKTKTPIYKMIIPQKEDYATIKAFLKKSSTK